VNENPDVPGDPLMEEEKEIGHQFENRQWRGDQENKMTN